VIVGVGEWLCGCVCGWVWVGARANGWRGMIPGPAQRLGRNPPAQRPRAGPAWSRGKSGNATLRSVFCLATPRPPQMPAGEGGVGKEEEGNGGMGY